MVGSDRVRLVLAIATVVFAATLLVSYAAPQVTGDELRDASSLERAFETGDREPVVEPRENVTVVATDSTAFISDDGSGPRQQAELVALAPDGSIYYHNDSHTRYWDVDPVSGTDATVEYVYAEHLDADECDAESVCTRNGVERVNLTTGDVTDVYSRITPGKHSTRWHDVDRLDEHRLLVADIDRDRAYVVNTTSQFVEWEWDAQSDFGTDSGGPYPEDWTHLNDVELVEIDGRDVVMISLRNQDQVVFVDTERGLMDEWTLGSEDDYDTMYEQHNPDFIPADRGGPAVVVADSENGRVVEYQRDGDSWEQSWTWEDSRLQWPRDADRLPNGNTLVTDSNGNRVIEVAPNGSVVWSVDIGFPYEAERLGTGDESAGGESASSLGLTSREPSADSGSERATQSVLDLLPKSVVNGIIYLLPSWVGPLQLVAAVGLLVAVPLWIRQEWRRTDLRIDLQSPLDLRRR